MTDTLAVTPAMEAESREVAGASKRVDCPYEETVFLSRNLKVPACVRS